MFSRRPGFRFNRGRVAVGPVAPGGGGGDTDPPALSSDPAVGATGLYIDFTLNEDSDEVVPSHTAFTLGGTPVLPIASGSSWLSATVFRQAVDSPILPSETVTVSCAAGTFKDAAGNNLGALSSQATTNNSAATLEHLPLVYLAGGSVNGHAPHRAQAWRCFATGAGSDGDNNTGSGSGGSATGGGGACALDTEAASEVGSYTLAVGAAGVGGVLGVGVTDGALTSVTAPSGLICQADPGLKGTAHATAATAGVGGTTGTGDTIRAGGDGVVSTAGANGGGGAGSSTAASGTTSGEPDGGLGPSSADATAGAGGGAPSTGTPGRAGGPGRVVRIFERAADNSFPRFVNGLAHSRDTAVGTARTVACPGSHAANDRLLLLAALNNVAGASLGGGTWTEFFDVGTATSALGYGIDSSGSESFSLATPNRRTNWAGFRLKNAAAVADWQGAGAAIASAATPSVQALTYSGGGSTDILWVTMIAWDSGTNRVTAGPAGWELIWTCVPNSTTASCGLGIAIQRASGTGSPSGSWTMLNAADGAVGTIAIPRA